MSQHQTADPQALLSTSIERVQFHDGQLVDADALTTATMFPVSLLQLVLRSYLGCGIVCGLEVIRPDEDRPCVRIRPGVIVDCHGYPVELCREVVLDLTPDPCTCETEPRTVCIVMRRATSEDAPRQPCGCGSRCGCGCDPASAGEHHDCNRVRDQVLIKAVELDSLDAVRDHVCANLPVGPGERDDCGTPGEREARGGSEWEPLPGHPMSEREHPDCECLMGCSERCCAERSWVLLACITIRPAADDGCASGYTLSMVDSRWRKYVKPIECCRSSHKGEQSLGVREPERPISQPAEPAEPNA